MDKKIKVKRFYAHCDLIEGTTDVWYCSFCNELVKDKHFKEEHLNKDHNKKFIATLDEWKRKEARGTSRVRPDNVPNRLKR